MLASHAVPCQKAAVTFRLVSLGFSILAAGCGGRATVEVNAPADATPEGAATAADSGAPLLDSGSREADAPATACTVSNYLDPDSFDVVAAAIASCLGGLPSSSCMQGVNTLSLSNLDQGVGPIQFVYSDASDGAHKLVGHGTPAVTPAPPGIVFDAQGIPAAVAFDEALSAFYSENGKVPFGCAWQ